MNHPEWIVVPWTFFAVALALKFWQFGRALKQHLFVATSSTDKFRQSLERHWEQEQGASIEAVPL